jgi:hypothetical protein
MDEEELEIYLNMIDQIERDDIKKRERPLREQLRDENGYRVPGCYRISPAEPNW